MPLLASLPMRTAPGLALSASGENHEAAIAAGRAPGHPGAAGVLAGGALGGIAGAALALKRVGTFADSMTAGRGFVAAETLPLRVAAQVLPVSTYVVQMLRYVLVRLGRCSAMPQAIGKPLVR